MKSKKLKIFFPIIVILISFCLAAYFYRILPPNIVTHWGIDGQPNGYSTKAFGLFFMPIISIVLLLIFLFLPKTDPYKTNFSQFKKYFENFVNIIISFLFYIYVLTLFWNSGYQFNMIQFISPAIGIIFYYAGVLMKYAKRNWFVGIRTPWTMSSDIVWDKTHKVGDKLFKIAGILCLLGVLIPQYSFFITILPILIFVVFIFIYSYLEYQKIS